MVVMKPEPIYRSIGAIVRQRRRRLEWPQETLAGRLGIKRATLANIETGRQRVLVHQLYALAAALGVKPNDLLPPAADGAEASGLRIDADLNALQMGQVASLIGPLKTPTPSPTGKANAPSAQRQKPDRSRS